MGADGKSKYEQFKALIKELTGAREVEIFSVISPDRVKPPFTDIRYAAHGSPYYSPVLLDGLMELNRDELESRLAVTVDMVPITFCSDDVCEEVRSLFGAVEKQTFFPHFVAPNMSISSSGARGYPYWPTACAT